MSDLYIKAVASIPSTGRSTATLMKTGQTTSYRTGDDGDLESGRGVDFFTLAENNPFGNTNRFTSELGTQIYTNNIVIDWSTYNGNNVLGYYRTLLASSIWDSAIDNCLSLSIGGFTSGWRLFNMNECVNICNWDPNISGRYNYVPFNISSSLYIQTSTTYRLTGFAMKILLGGGEVVADPKLNSHSAMAVRTFTVIGTTLS